MSVEGSSTSALCQISTVLPSSLLISVQEMVGTLGVAWATVGLREDLRGWIILLANWTWALTRQGLESGIRVLVHSVKDLISSTCLFTYYSWVYRSERLEITGSKEIRRKLFLISICW